MTTLDDFKRLLNANPENTDTLLILADWLDEGNGLYGAGYRAMGVLRLYPYYFSGSKCHGWIDMESRHFNAPVCHTLPDQWFRAIERNRHVIGDSWEVSTPRNTKYGPFVLFKAAAKAFCKLPLPRQQELLGLVTS